MKTSCNLITKQAASTHTYSVLAANVRTMLPVTLFKITSTADVNFTHVEKSQTE